MSQQTKQNKIVKHMRTKTKKKQQHTINTVIGAHSSPSVGLSMHAPLLSFPCNVRKVREFQLSQPFSSSPSCQLFHFFFLCWSPHLGLKSNASFVLCFVSCDIPLHNSSSPSSATLTLVSTIYSEVRESRSRLDQNTASKNGYTRWIAYRCQGLTI